MMGFAILIQNRSHSKIKLANALKYLAIFGIMHGLSEWAVIFIPIQAELVGIQTKNLMLTLELFVTTLSFLFLFLFGAQLLQDFFIDKLWIKRIPGLFYGFWLVLFFYKVTSFNGTDYYLLLNSLDSLGRYLLAFPGSILSGFGLLLHRKELLDTGISKASKSLLKAAIFFFLYGFLAGLVVREAEYFPAIWLNKNNFFLSVGVPVQIFRALCGAAISIYMIRTLEIFNIEYRQRLEQAEKNHAIFIERERICRDLHDGIIQEIYAVGLGMESSLLLVQNNPNKAKMLINNNMKQLDLVIKDIRNYILGLKPVRFDDSDFYGSVTNLIEQCKANSSSHYNYQIDPNIYEYTAKNKRIQIYHIILEALTNIQKHAQATMVNLNLSIVNGQLTLDIKDNGVGFNISSLSLDNNGECQGIKNMKERVSLIDGRINIDSLIGQGTLIHIITKVDSKGGKISDAKNKSISC